MIKKHLLEKELNQYPYYPNEMKPVHYDSKLLPRLLDKFNDFGMVESSYCCYGEECCCWQEVIEDGINGLTIESVIRNFKWTFKHIRKYLYNQKKYGRRLYMFEDKERCYIYIYLRDKIGVDYALWFGDEGACV